MSTYEVMKSEEWYEIDWTDWSISCCDCGLVHKFSFRVDGDKLMAKAVRFNRATGQIRRHMKNRKSSPHKL